MLSDAKLCVCADRHATSPPGLFGGKPGKPARYVLDPGTDHERVLSSKTPYVPLPKGTLVYTQSAGGGGYGDPKERDPARVRADLRDGYITNAQIYGVNSP
jgi:N-methylhydantoinase B